MNSLTLKLRGLYLFQLISEMRDITALRAMEIHELMANDYPIIYSVSLGFIHFI